MITTSVFSRNLNAYVNDAPLIVNQGGTSSSKTFSVLQMLFLIALKSETRLIISVVSYALPHLKLGAIRDFENILIGEGYRIDEVKNKTDLYYNIGASTIEFFSADNLGKVHGPRRDILFLNECNHLKYDIYTQLSIRTRRTIILDYNPTNEFWAHTEVIPNERHTFIKSTYLDNEMLDARTVERIESRKGNENWWRVYGLGEIGRLEGAILQNWEYGDFDNNLPYGYGMDFGVKDPDALVKIAVDKKGKKLYWKEEIYQSGNSTYELAELVKSKGVGSKLIIAESASPRTIIDLKAQGLNVKPVSKTKIVEDIKLLDGWQIIVDPQSYNLAKELQNWVWMDKRGEVPLDDFNHLIDAARYYSKTMIASKPERTSTIYRQPRNARTR
jgi:phage terminase large subunit